MVQGEPRFVPEASASGSLILTPYYDVVSQVGADVQYTKEAWLWKLEAIGRSCQGDDFGALADGVEYTFYSVQGTNTDFGLLAEYLYDARDESAPPTSLDDDVFVGVRFTLNDPDDTNILAGAIVDPSDGETITLIEAQRRLSEHWKLELDLCLLTNVPERGRLYGADLKRIAI